MILSNKGKYKFIVGSLAAAAVISLVVWSSVDFSFRGHMEGIYLLKNPAGHSLRIADDVYLGEEDILIAGVNFEGLHKFLNMKWNHDRPYLEVEWDKADGTGYVRNYLGGDKVLMTEFSRYADNSGKDKTHGLFIGGALPEALLDARVNNSGMSYFDGERWSHIWCNTNEGIGSSISPHRYPPGSWHFLGSRIVSRTAEHVVLLSEHQLAVDGVLLRMERTVEMTAGTPDLNLTVRIYNPGNDVANYFYYYGDEPWLGDFGSASGDVGWVDGRLVEYEEYLDPKRVSYAGIADYGSSVLGEGHNYSHAANFIAWLGPDKPDIAFFANQYRGLTLGAGAPVPLQGDSRSIGMYWGPEILSPGQEQIFKLAIGMAEHNPATGLPRIPAGILTAQTVLSAAHL